MEDSLVNRAHNYAKKMITNSEYQGGFSDGAFHGYQEGAISQKNIDIDETVKWLRNNWREYIKVDADGMICFNMWENDYRTYMKDN